MKSIVISKVQFVTFDKRNIYSVYFKNEYEGCSIKTDIYAHKLFN